METASGIIIAIIIILICIIISKWHTKEKEQTELRKNIFFQKESLVYIYRYLKNRSKSEVDADYYIDYIEKNNHIDEKHKRDLINICNYLNRNSDIDTDVDFYVEHLQIQDYVDDYHKEQWLEILKRIGPSIGVYVSW
jgi:hypothetical protein